MNGFVGEPQGEFANTILMEDKADIVIDAGTGWVSSLTTDRVCQSWHM